MFQVTIVRLISKLLHFTSIFMTVAFHSNKKKRLLVTRFPNLFYAIIPKTKVPFQPGIAVIKKRFMFYRERKRANDFLFHNFGFVYIWRLIMFNSVINANAPEPNRVFEPISKFRLFIHLFNWHVWVCTSVCNAEALINAI